jgi:hypothetical protein
MAKVKEDKIQKWLEKKYSDIKRLINNVDKFEDLNTDQIPYYSLDYLIKKKVAESSKYVYDLLDDVDVIIANKNISLDKTERLFPDLLLFSPENSTFFIIEIKRDEQAERQAITELLAYEHELKNLFPFMSNIEVCFILIASDFNTLLSHSVSSLSLWQNKKILPLKINGIENEDENEWSLSLYLPTSWTLLSLDSFKSEHISTTNLVLENKGAYTYNRDVNIKEQTVNFDILMRGMELIVKEAERNNVSGFVLLSRLTSSHLANWCFTICVVNPFSFYNNLDYTSKIKDSFNTKYQGEEFFSRCTTEITSKSKKYLEIFFKPYFENFIDWKSQKKNLKNISEPISIDFFGQIDDIVNNFVINKEVRDYYYPEINNENLDWKNARIGLNIIDNILYDNVFIEGKFDYYGFYKFGTYIGTLCKYFNILKNNIELFENECFLGKLLWIEIEFINAYRELFLFKGDEHYPMYKSISKNEIDLPIENLNLIIDYMLEKFIDIDTLKEAFSFGLKINNYYIDDKQFIHEDDVKDIERFIIDYSKDFIKDFINGEFETLKEEFQEDLVSYIEMYKNKLEDCTKFSFNSIEDNCLIELFEEDTIKIISMLNPNLVNTSSNFTFQDLDIPRLKELYIEEYRKSKDVVVVLQQNGNINTVKDETSRIFNINPEEQLLFKVNSHLSVIRQIKWEELKNENIDFSSIDLTKFYNEMYKNDL